MTPPTSVRTLRGFTLMELTVVLAIMALLAGVATVKLTGLHREAKLIANSEQVALFDQCVRGHARRFGHATELTFHLGTNTLQEKVPQRNKKSGRRLQFSGNTNIDRVIVDGRLLTSGRATIRYTKQGQSPSYAFRLTSGKSHRWLVIAGVTGQFTLVNDQRIAGELLADTPRL